MRTTVNIQDSLLADAKRMAAERGVSLSTIVADALRCLLANDSYQNPIPFHLHVVGGELVDSSLDLNRTSELLDLDNEVLYPHGPTP